MSGARGVTILFTGLSGAGKTTLACALEARIVASGRAVTLLDGDAVRRELSSGLSMSEADRLLHVKRCAWVAAEIARHGGVTLCALIAPMQAMRDAMRARCEATGAFVLIHVATPLATCAARDVKGLYARAMAGELPGFTGVSAPYEPPLDADLTIHTDAPLEQTIAQLWDQLAPHLHLRSAP
jgi:sulfate adenylyltransferase